MKARAHVVAEAGATGRTRLTTLRSQAPLVLRRTGDVVTMVAGAGGPLGGDDLHVDLDVRRGRRPADRQRRGDGGAAGGTRDRRPARQHPAHRAGRARSRGDPALGARADRRVDRRRARRSCVSALRRGSRRRLAGGAGPRPAGRGRRQHLEHPRRGRRRPAGPASDDAHRRRRPGRVGRAGRHRRAPGDGHPADARRGHRPPRADVRRQHGPPARPHAAGGRRRCCSPCSARRRSMCSA